MGTQNTIKLNGKRYDALTGKLAAPRHAPEPAKTHRRQHTDGFIQGKPQAMQPAKPAKPEPAQLSTPSHTARAAVPRRAGKAHPAHQPAHSKTLMRAAVRKPEPLKRLMHRAHAPAGSTPPRELSTTSATARSIISERQLSRAQQVRQSPIISRFRSTANHQAGGAASRPRPAAIPKPVPLRSPRPGTTPRDVQSASDKLDDLLASGLAHATAHEQPLLSKTKASKKEAKAAAVAERKGKRGKRRSHKPLVAVGVLIVLLLVIGGVVFYQALPRIDLSIAASRSGVHATLPSYKPAGFRFAAPVTYNKGTLTMSFREASTNQTFKIVEQNSDWDSQTLRDSFVATTDPTYQTLQKDGRTIYIYNEHNITWVNDGIWYQITGNSGLTDSQLVQIALSM